MSMEKTNKVRVLLIEDEKILADMYRDVFQHEGYDFLTSSNIEIGLSLVEFERPDVVLLDLIIPKPENTIAEQGYEFLENIKKNDKISTIPVIVFSNIDTIQDRIKCKEMGAAGFLFKRDVTPEEVVNTVAEVVKRSRAAQNGTPLPPEEPSVPAQL